jgi:polyisoprenoid-binding protein YceI
MSQTTWNIDTTHSSVGFWVRHLVISKVHGRFTKWNGTITLGEDDISKSSVEVTIEAASIETHEAKRDAHLRSADFFDVEKFPALMFKSKKVQKSGDALAVRGDLTIHGVTREVLLETESLGRAKDPWGGERIGFSAKTNVDRKDFGLHWNQALETGGVLVGDKIEITLEIEAVKAAEAVKKTA